MCKLKIQDTIYDEVRSRKGEVYMYNLNWSRKELTSQKLGRFCEYYAKMSLASYGMNIYTSEVDDHGIDFVAETQKHFLKFQVKSIRQGTNYVYVRKSNFDITDSSLYLILLLLEEGKQPDMYMILSSAWNNTDSRLFVYHSYDGKKSEPEYGINISQRNMSELEKYKINKIIDRFI